MLATEVKPGSSAAPKVENADVANDRRDESEHVGHTKLRIVVFHVQNSEVQQIYVVCWLSLIC